MNEHQKQGKNDTGIVFMEIDDSVDDGDDDDVGDVDDEDIDSRETLLGKISCSLNTERLRLTE